MTLDEPKAVQELDEQQQAQIVPELYFNFLADPGDKKIEPALIFTRSDLLVIKQYVKRVHRLPDEPSVVADRDGFAELGIDCQDIVHFYKNLKRHAGSWELLENQTKDLGSQIEGFSDEFMASGEGLISALQSMEGYRNLKLNSVELEDFKVAPVPLSDDDLQVIEQDIPGYLEELKLEIGKISGWVTDVKKRADHFSRQIGVTLNPTVDLLVRRISNIDVLEKLNSLRDEVGALDAAIAEKDKEYATFIGYSFSGLVFGPVGVLVTGGIYGARAEVVRVQRNELKEQRSALNRTIEMISPIVGELEDQGTVLKDLQFRLIHVEVAAKNLEDVWRMLDVYIDRSETSLEAIKTDVQVAKFIWDFRKVLRPWGKISSISMELSKIFNEPTNDQGEDAR